MFKSHRRLLPYVLTLLSVSTCNISGPGVRGMDNKQIKPNSESMDEKEEIASLLKDADDTCKACIDLLPDALINLKERILSDKSKLMTPTERDQFNTRLTSLLESACKKAKYSGDFRSFIRKTQALQKKLENHPEKQRDPRVISTLKTDLQEIKDLRGKFTDLANCRKQMVDLYNHLSLRKKRNDAFKVKVKKYDLDQQRQLKWKELHDGERAKNILEDRLSEAQKEQYPDPSKIKYFQDRLDIQNDINSNIQNVINENIENAIKRPKSELEFVKHSVEHKMYLPSDPPILQDYVATTGDKNFPTDPHKMTDDHEKKVSAYYNTSVSKLEQEHDSLSLLSEETKLKNLQNLSKLDDPSQYLWTSLKCSSENKSQALQNRISYVREQLKNPSYIQNQIDKTKLRIAQLKKDLVQRKLEQGITISNEPSFLKQYTDVAEDKKKEEIARYDEIYKKLDSEISSKKASASSLWPSSLVDTLDLGKKNTSFLSDVLSEDGKLSPGRWNKRVDVPFNLNQDGVPVEINTNTDSPMTTKLRDVSDSGIAWPEVPSSLKKALDNVDWIKSGIFVNPYDVPETCKDLPISSKWTISLLSHVMNKESFLEATENPALMKHYVSAVLKNFRLESMPVETYVLMVGRIPVMCRLRNKSPQRLDDSSLKIFATASEKLRNLFINYEAWPLTVSELVEGLPTKCLNSDKLNYMIFCSQWPEVAVASLTTKKETKEYKESVLTTSMSPLDRRHPLSADPYLGILQHLHYRNPVDVSLECETLTEECPKLNCKLKANILPDPSKSALASTCWQLRIVNNKLQNIFTIAKMRNRSNQTLWCVPGNSVCWVIK